MRLDSLSVHSCPVVRSGLQPQRRAVTLLELMIVISIGILLSSAALPSIMRSRERGLVTTATTVVADLHSKALQLARVDSDAPGAQWYSLQVSSVGDKQVVTLMRGTGASTTVVSQRTIPGGLAFWADTTTATGTDLVKCGTVQWWYMPMSGKTVATYGSRAPVSIGTPRQSALPANNQVTSGAALPMIAESPVASSLTLFSANGQIRAALAIYSSGLYNDVTF